MGMPLAVAVASRGRTLSYVDTHIGTRIRLYRNALGFSQTVLGDQVGVSYQQIQKFERGDVRVSAAMLLALAQALAVPLSRFFEGLSETTDAQTPECDKTESAAALQLEDEQLMVRRETLELVRAYYRVGDLHRRRSVFDLIQSMSGASTPAPP